jgi:hypothetical protein
MTIPQHWACRQGLSCLDENLPLDIQLSVEADLVLRRVPRVWQPPPWIPQSGSSNQNLSDEEALMTTLEGGFWREENTAERKIMIRGRM